MTSPGRTLPRILVVEDEAVPRMLLQVYLRSWPVEVRFCPDAESALDAFGAFHPDLVFMDLVLPGMDGMDAIERIRHLAEGNRVPIVVTSSMGDARTSIEAREAGASTFLAKPLQMGHVANVLERFLGLRAPGHPLAAAV